MEPDTREVEDAVDRFMRRGGDPEILREAIDPLIEWWLDERAAAESGYQDGP